MQKVSGAADAADVALLQGPSGVSALAHLRTSRRYAFLMVTSSASAGTPSLLQELSCLSAAAACALQ